MAYLVISVFIFIVELCVKKHMDAVRTLDEQRVCAGGRIILKKYYNTGAAGNFLNRYPLGMQCLHAAVLGGVLTELFHILPKKGMGLVKLGLAFAAGGGCSNLHDRLTKGHVVDYVSFGFGPKRFRKLVFNIADFFVFSGVILLIINILFKKEGMSWNHKG